MATARFFRSGVRAAAALLALGLGLAACGGDGGNDSPAGAATQAPRQGGSVTMLSLADSRTLDPFLTSYVAVADDPRLSALYDPLVYIDPASGQVRPHVAQSLTTEDGGRSWTLKLRPGVQFSDGTPFDAEAVRLTWEMHANPEVRSNAQTYARGLVMRVADPLTLVVNPPVPNPSFDRTVATRLMYIEAPSALAKGLQAAGAQPVGAGPFMLKSWTRGSEQVFVRNPLYWQRDKGLPRLDQVTFKVVPDREQQYNTVKSGGADLVQNSYGEYIERARKELRVVEQKNEGGQNFTFNMRRPPFDDPRARRAIALALDPQEIPKVLNNGFSPARNLFNSTSQYFDPAAVQPAPDRAEAQRLFDELAAEGKKVDFTFLISQSGLKTAEFIQSRLHQYRNVTMRIEALEIGAYIVKYTVAKDFQALQHQSWIADPEPDMYGMLHSASPQNYAGWQSAEADRVLEEARAATDPAARKAAYSKLQRLMVTDLPVWVYAESSVGLIHAKHVVEAEVYNTGTVFFDRLGVTR